MSLEKHLYAYSLGAPRIPEASASGTTVWFEGGRWLVLVDGETSSGAAWLAGVLKELNRAMLLGSTADSTSMSVFTIRPIGPSKEVSAIRYETGRLVLPSGNFLAAGELAPDVSIRPKQLVKPFPKSGVDWSSDPFYETVQSKLRQ